MIRDARIEGGRRGSCSIRTGMEAEFFVSIRFASIGLALSGVLIAQQASEERASGEVAQLREALAAQQKQLQLQQEQIEQLRAVIGKQSESQERTWTAKASPSHLTISNAVATTRPGATTVSWTTNVPASSFRRCVTTCPE